MVDFWFVAEDIYRVSVFCPRLSYLLCVQMSLCCLLFHGLSLSVQGHLISLKYLQQASGPDRHFIPYSPSIHSSQQPSPVPLCCQGQIKLDPTFTSFSSLPCLCECMCVCSPMHHHINKNLHLCVCFVSATEREPVTLSISLFVCVSPN